MTSTPPPILVFQKIKRLHLPNWVNNYKRNASALANATQSGHDRVYGLSGTVYNNNCTAQPEVQSSIQVTPNFRAP